MSLPQPFQHLASLELTGAVELAALAQQQLETARHGDLPRFLAAVATAPRPRACQLAFARDAPLIGTAEELSREQQQSLHRCVQELGPWRKGPFSLFGIDLDAEWRCDLKWRRLAPHVELRDASVLDVGAGNGYYCLRAVGAGASLALGVDPTWLYFAQFYLLQSYLSEPRAFVLPFRFEQLSLQARFDVVLSMGVVYHQRRPEQHLQALSQRLNREGQLVVESLIMPESFGADLVPEERYAGMRNVFCVPTLATLRRWVEGAGLRDLRVVDLTTTTNDEQRVTPYSGQRSLADVLDVDRPELTVEGYPRPLRALLIATRK